MGNSRLLIKDVYAWSIGAHGFCVGVVGFGSNCVPLFAKAVAVGPTLIAKGASGRSVVAGITSDSVLRVGVEANSRELCSAIVHNNGFACYPATSPTRLPVILRLVQRNGAVRVVPLSSH
jgi:hypothetical protein